MEVRFVGDYRVGGLPLSAEAERALCELLAQPSVNGRGGLSGRRAVTYSTLEGVGKIVVKHYSRGGLLRYFVTRRYFRVGMPRSRTEFQLLTKVRALGVQAPEPIVWIEEGGLFYRAWLVTREVEQSETLADVALRDEDRAREVVQLLAAQLKLLIEHRIFHVDLHPGNVLVDGQGAVHLVDFDKAGTFSGSRARLRDKYIWRWRRAVLKHELPELLNEALCLGLRYHLDS